MNAYPSEEILASFKETTTVVCFGAMMGLTATIGMVGAFSFLFLYFVS
jgi:hypothetical protein